LTTKVLYKPL